MAAVRADIAGARVTDIHVLITGETGTGKELVAEAIHEGSDRRARSFVRINCAAIPESLVENELFGHERGAFTGAESQRGGLLEDGAGGTVFFDEVGDMSPLAQAKILRVIENKEVRRLGGRGTILIDIRVLAATNQDLEQRVSGGAFRADLYYRLNVARIHVPPLRQHKEDIPELTDHYIKDCNQRFGGTVEGVDDAVLQRWLQYDWPGNVRELRNVVESSFLKARSGRISLSALSGHFLELLERRHGTTDERQQLLDALFRADWNKTRAAETLRWSRMTLYRRLAKHGLNRPLPPGERADGPPLRSPIDTRRRQRFTNRP